MIEFVDFDNDWIDADDIMDIGADDFEMSNDEEMEMEQLMEFYNKKYGKLRIAR